MLRLVSAIPDVALGQSGQLSIRNARVDVHCMLRDSQVLELAHAEWPVCVKSSFDRSWPRTIIQSHWCHGHSPLQDG